MRIRRTSQLVCVLMAVVLASFPISGAGAAGLVDEDLKNATKLEEKGEYSRAAEAYARALRLEPGNKKAKSGLSRVAGRAITAKLDRARSYEASLRFTDAHAELMTAVTLQDRVRAAGIRLEVETDAASASAVMIDRWVGHLYGEAIQAQNDELWSAAVAHLSKIESLQPGTMDVRSRLAEVWTSWGDQELELRMFRSAAGRFTEASRVPGFASGPAARRAAMILDRLGTHALEKGACRSAFLDLGAAVTLAPDAVDSGVLAAAEACALTCLVLAVGSDRELEMDTTRLESLGAEIRDLIVNRGSRFLTVSMSGLAARGPCIVRPTTGAPGAGSPEVLRRIRATIEVSSQVILRSPATSRVSEFRSSQSMGGEVVGESVTMVRVYDEVFSGSMTGTITLTDQKTGRSSPAFPVRVQGENSAQWVKNPSTVVSAGTAVRPSGISDQPGIPGINRLTRIDDQRLDARSRLKDALRRDFVIEVARIVLETIDAEPGISDPVSIDLGFVAVPGG